MTPAQRQTNSALKWMKILLRDTSAIAEEIQKIVNESAFDEKTCVPLQAAVVKLRKTVKRCAYHGLGMSAQEFLPLNTKEPN